MLSATPDEPELIIELVRSNGVGPATVASRCGSLVLERCGCTCRHVLRDWHCGFVELGGSVSVSS